MVANFIYGGKFHQVLLYNVHTFNTKCEIMNIRLTNSVEVGLLKNCILKYSVTITLLPIKYSFTD